MSYDMKGRLCPVCKSTLLVKFIGIAYPENLTYVSNCYICKTCTAICNANAFENLEHNNQFSIQNTDLYYVDNDISLSILEENINSISPTIQYLYDHNFIDKFDNFMDLGCGTGYAGFAAKKNFHFKNVVLCDFDLRGARNIGNIICSDGIQYIENIEDADSDIFDIVYAWHVLEHIDNPADFVANVNSKLAVGGVFYFQVPLFSADAIIDCHFVIYSEESIRYLFRGLSWKIEAIIYDYSNNFLSGIIRKR